MRSWNVPTCCGCRRSEAAPHINHHDGSIQQVAGKQIDTSRNDFFSGLGASTYGVGSPIVPGVWANFQLADAIFQPLAASKRSAHDEPPSVRHSTTPCCKWRKPISNYFAPSRS